MKDSKSCRGCTTYNDETAVCNNFIHKTRCPCQTCLIKVVCVRGCDDIRSYLSQLHKKGT